MPASESTEPSLRAENAELRARLEEAEDTLRAIRGGGVDALVVEGDAGPQLFTLQGLDAEQNRLRGEMLAKVSDAVIAVDTARRITFFNAAAERQYGVSAGDVLGRHIAEAFTTSWTGTDADAAMRTALRERGEWRGELIHRTRGGRDLTVESVVTMLRDPDGAGTGYVAVIRDISGRRQAEAALLLANQRFDLAVKCSQVVLFQQDSDLRYTWLRNAVPGFEGSAAIGKTDLELMEVAADAALVEALKREVMRSGVGLRREVLIHVQGAGRHFDLLVEPQRDAAGLISGVTCAAIDITERKAAAEARHESERQYRALAEASSEVAYRMSADWSTMLPLEGRELVASSDQPLADWAWLNQNLPRDEHARVRQAISDAIALKTLFEMEHRVRRPDGSTGWTLSRAVPILDKNEDVIAWFGAASDITERKEAEEGRRLLASIVENSRDFIGISDTHGNLVYGNLAAMELVGVQDLEHVRRSKIIDYFIPEQRPFVEEVVLPAVVTDGRWSGELTMQHFVTGAKIPVWYDLFRVDDPVTGQPVNFATITRDLTESKRVEKALADRTELLNGVLESTTDVIFVKDLNGRLLLANGAFAAAAGSTPEQLVGKMDGAWFPPDVAAAVRQQDEAVLAGGSPMQFEDTVPVAGEARSFLTLKAPLRDGSSRVIGVLGIGRDITERKAAEEALRGNAVMLADLDRRKDAFLATLSHELRNPLGVIGSSLHLLRLTGQDRDAVQRGCARMQRQVVLLTRLIDDLMDVSRINEDKLTLRTERLDLATVAQGALENSRTVLDQRGHTVTVVLPPQPIKVDGDVTRLAQVVSNLLTNAAKYSDPGSPIVLTVERQGDVAALAVRDRGIGIASPDLRRVFELFAQVRGAAHLAQGGLGIGLNLVKRVVELHGGSVEARSDGLGHGSEFIVRLPLASSGEARADRPPDHEVPSPSPSRRYRILVADDNEDAVTTLALLLRHLGHDVRTAENGAQAVAIAATFRPEVALLDLGMPELDGHEACRLIRAQPGGDTMVLIAVSGWGQDDDKRRARDSGFNDHLVKPVNPAALTALLHALAPT